jgi:hypothetical protein
LPEAILLTLTVGLIVVLMFYVSRNGKPGVEKSLGMFSYKAESTSSEPDASKKGQ